MLSIISEPAIYIALTLVCANLLHLFVHGVLAMLLGIRIDEMSVFYFGRSHHRINNTAIRVGWLPLGSYVAPAGAMPPDYDPEAAANLDTPREFEYRSRPYWQRGLFSLAGVLSLAFGVIACILLANPHKNFIENCIEWWSQMRLFFGYLAWQISPKPFVDILYHLNSRELLLLTGASWLSLMMVGAILPTGVVGRAIWRFLHLYDNKFSALITGLFIAFVSLSWVYMAFMMCFMIIKVWNMASLLVFVLNFLVTSCFCTLIIRWVAHKIGKNA